MKLSIGINKRMIFISLFVVFLMLSFTLIQKVYAGKLTISLNSPASFPIDI